MQRRIRNDAGNDVRMRHVAGVVTVDGFDRVSDLEHAVGRPACDNRGDDIPAIDSCAKTKPKAGFDRRAADRDRQRRPDHGDLRYPEVVLPIADLHIWSTFADGHLLVPGLRPAWRSVRPQHDDIYRGTCNDQVDDALVRQSVRRDTADRYDGVCDLERTVGRAVFRDRCHDVAAILGGPKTEAVAHPFVWTGQGHSSLGTGDGHGCAPQAVL